MKKRILITMILILVTCGKEIIYPQKNYTRIFKTYEVGDYTLFEGVEQNDTIVFVAKTNIFKDCNKKACFINKDNLKQIGHLKFYDSIVYFKYKILDQNKKILIETSELPPTNNDSFFIETYSKYPFYIDNCKAFL